MRLLVIFSAAILLTASPSFSKNETSFEEFMQSREVVATFYFEKNADSLTKSEYERASRALSELKTLQQNGKMIRVEGFSSPEGDREKNFELSFYRAKSVADILEAGGLPAEVTLTGYGDLKAGQENPSKERRVEVAAYMKPVGLKKIKIAKHKSPRFTALPKQNVPEEQLQPREIDSYEVDQAIRRKVDDKTKSIADQLKKIEEELAPGISQNKSFTSEEELERGYTQWRRSVDPDYAPKVTQDVKQPARGPQYGYSQTQEKAAEDTPKLGQAKDSDSELQRGYTRIGEKNEKVVPKLGQAKDGEKDLQRGYSRLDKKPAEEKPKLGQAKARDNKLQRSLTKWIESIESARTQDVTLLWPADPPPSVETEAQDVAMVLPDEMAPTIDALMIEQAIMDKIGVEPTVTTGSLTQVELNKPDTAVQ